LLEIIPPDAGIITKSWKVVYSNAKYVLLLFHMIAVAEIHYGGANDPFPGMSEKYLLRSLIDLL
jgi:hypothetical protein